MEVPNCQSIVVKKRKNAACSDGDSHSFRRDQGSTLISPESGNAFAAFLQANVGKGLSCQDRLHNIRRKRGQLQHSPDVAAVDALLFGDVLEVFELPRFQLLLPGARFG